MRFHQHRSSSAFDPISLAEMDGVKLQDRVDTKYVFGEHRLAEVMEAMLPHYRLWKWMACGARSTAVYISIHPTFSITRTIITSVRSAAR
jgi:hypothetical protein